jgi:hypothetical protein
VATHASATFHIMSTPNAQNKRQSHQYSSEFALHDPRILFVDVDTKISLEVEGRMMNL